MSILIRVEWYMIKIIDDSLENFNKDIAGKTLYVFGAGRRLVHLCETLRLNEQIVAIIDNNKLLWNTSFVFQGSKIPIINVEQFVSLVDKQALDEIVLLITPAFYAWKIVEQLDEQECLDGLRCYISGLLMEHYESQDFSFSKGEVLIPKKIHYCWFGGAEIPVKLQNYIDTWKKVCPDYEIIRWDESNFNVSQNVYMKQAYDCKKWGFVSDCARLHIIYREGGIYLDTDVELLRSLDDLLCDEMFCHADSNTSINFGVGFGAVKGHELIKQLRDFYDNKEFINDDGSMDLRPCYMYQNPVLMKNGFVIKNGYQRNGKCVLYPSEVAAPTGLRGMENNFSDKTISVHHSELSWISEEERINLKHYQEKIVHRINRGVHGVL